jgi:hypothetical protein
MNLKFEELFNVEFRHQFYGENTPSSGITVKSSESTARFFLNNRLLFKNLKTGFKIGYDTGNTVPGCTREEVLKDEPLLIFRLDLTD